MPGEILFSAGPLCEHMLFVSHGSIRYRKLTDAADAGFANTGDAGAGGETAQYFFFVMMKMVILIGFMGLAFLATFFHLLLPK